MLSLQYLWILIFFGMLVSFIKGRNRCVLVSNRIYFFRIRLNSKDTGRIMFCDSQPCIKANLCHNRVVVDFFWILYRSPTLRHITNHAPQTWRRMFLSHEVSLFAMQERKPLYETPVVGVWRFPINIVMILPSSLQLNCIFTSLSRTTRECLHMRRKPLQSCSVFFKQFIGSQTISISNTSNGSEFNYLRLVFSQQGLCELKGVITCSLVDIRYHQTVADIENGEIVMQPQTLDEYLFSDCDVFLPSSLLSRITRRSNQSGAMCRLVSIQRCVGVITIQRTLSTSSSPTIKHIALLMTPRWQNQSLFRHLPMTLS